MSEYSQLPLGWVASTIGEVANQAIEQAGPNSAGTFLYVDISSIDRSTKRIVDAKVLRVESAPSRARQRLQPGDVLVSMTRPNLNAVAILPTEMKGAIGSTGFFVLRSHHVTAKWLFFLVQTASFVDAMSNLVLGVLYPAVRPKDIASHILFLPPAREQNRIVAEIEKQFTRLDAAVAALKRVQANLKRYRAAVLKAACKGRLVPTEAELARKEGRSYETGEQLLARILKQRRAKWEAALLAKMQASGKPPKGDDWKNKYKEAQPPDAGNLPPLPEGWTWATLDQMTTLITSGSRGWAEHYADHGVHFIRAQDIKTDELNLQDIAFVELPSKTEGTRTRVQLHDILVTITGANVTRTALVERNLTEAYVSQHVGLVRPILQDIALFLYAWIISPADGRAVLEKAAYGAGKPGLNLDHLRELAIAMPPIAEQQRITAELRRRLSVTDATAAATVPDILRSERLRQSILKRAFEGKLVPQDPNDDPASALLDRIRTDRGMKSVVNPGQRRKAHRLPLAVE